MVAVLQLVGLAFGMPADLRACIDGDAQACLAAAHRMDDDAAQAKNDDDRARDLLVAACDAYGGEVCLDDLLDFDEVDAFERACRPHALMACEGLIDEALRLWAEDGDLRVLGRLERACEAGVERGCVEHRRLSAGPRPASQRVFSDREVVDGLAFSASGALVVTSRSEVRVVEPTTGKVVSKDVLGPPRPPGLFYGSDDHGVWDLQVDAEGLLRGIVTLGRWPERISAEFPEEGVWSPDEAPAVRWFGGEGGRLCAARLFDRGIVGGWSTDGTCRRVREARRFGWDGELLGNPFPLQRSGPVIAGGDELVTVHQGRAWRWDGGRWAGLTESQPWKDGWLLDAGRRLVLTGPSGWELRSVPEDQVLAAGRLPLQSAVASADGRWIALLDDVSGLELRAAETGEPAFPRWSSGMRLERIAVSADGQWIAAAPHSEPEFACSWRPSWVVIEAWAGPAAGPWTPLPSPSLLPTAPHELRGRTSRLSGPGKPGEGMTLRLNHRGQDPLASVLERETVVDAEGTWQFEGVPWGDWEVVAALGGYKPVWLSAREPFEMDPVSSWEDDVVLVDHDGLPVAGAVWSAGFHDGVSDDDGVVRPGGAGGEVLVETTDLRVWTVRPEPGIWRLGEEVKVRRAHCEDESGEPCGALLGDIEDRPGTRPGWFYWTPAERALADFMAPSLIRSPTEIVEPGTSLAVDLPDDAVVAAIVDGRLNASELRDGQGDWLFGGLAHVVALGASGQTWDAHLDLEPGQDWRGAATFVRRPEGRVRVRFDEPDGTPMAGRTVAAAELESGASISLGVTDLQGRVSLQLGAGRWVIWAGRYGRVQAQEVVTVRAGAEVDLGVLRGRKRPDGDPWRDGVYFDGGAQVEGVSPAAPLGRVLRRGDRIVRWGGRSTRGWTTAEMSARLQVADDPVWAWVVGAEESKPRRVRIPGRWDPVDADPDGAPEGRPPLDP